MVERKHQLYRIGMVWLYLLSHSGDFLVTAATSGGRGGTAVFIFIWFLKRCPLPSHHLLSLSAALDSQLPILPCIDRVLVQVAN